MNIRLKGRNATTCETSISSDPCMLLTGCNWKESRIAESSSVAKILEVLNRVWKEMKRTGLL